MLLAALLIRTDAAWHFDSEPVGRALSRAGREKSDRAAVRADVVSRRADSLRPPGLDDEPRLAAQAAGRAVADGRQHGDVRRERDRHAAPERHPGDALGVADLPDRLPSSPVRRSACMAAAFHAINGFLVSLSSGRRVADHVDTALIFWIELGVWCAIVHARRRDPWSLAAIGTRAGRGVADKVTSSVAPRRRGLFGLHRTRAARQSRASRRRRPGNRRRNLGAVDDLCASRVSARSGMVGAVHGAASCPPS